VYHRGIAVVQAPTTLLAQVDAAIGGKTAVNLPEGKNLVGAFHQPLAVLSDVTTLATLPPREYRAGLGEVAKYALMPGGDTVATLVRDERAAIVDREPRVLTALVAACAAMKAAVVAADPEERTGVRASLNYGHTLAHALEATQPDGEEAMRHGEAVAVGLAFAARLAERIGRIDAPRVAEHDEVLEVFGLEGALPLGCSGAGLVRAMRRDKKAHHDLTLVLDGPSGIEVVDGVGELDVLATLRQMGAGQ